MNTLLDTAEPWLHAIATLSWKGALLTLAVGLVMLLLRRHLSPAWRHGLWLLVLLRFVVPEMGTSSLSMNRIPQVPVTLASQTPDLPEFMPTPQPVEVAMAQIDSTPDMAAPVQARPLPAPAPAPWTLWQKLTLVWLLGVVVVFAAMLALHLRLLWRLRHDASEPSTHITTLLQTVCTLAGIRRMPQLIVTDAVRAPAIFGIIRPAILLPRELATTGEAASLRLILLHELAHLQRRDLWAQIIASLIIALHWFNPIVWWAGRRMRAEAEMAADARALRSTDVTEAHRLGEVLLGFAHRATAGWLVWFATSTLLGISENKRDLKRRIEALMDIAKGRRTRWVVGLSVFSIFAVVGLTKAPAEDAKKEQTKEAKPIPAPATSSSAKLTRVFGKVTDDKSNPVAGAEVNLTINLLSGSGSGNQRTKADAEGRFSFEKLTELAEYIVSARHPDHMDSSIVRVNGYDPAKESLILLPQTLWVTGKVIDKRTGRPIEDARVFFGLERKQSLIVNDIGRYEWKLPSAYTSKTGEYRLPIKVREAEEIIVRAWAPDMTSHSQRLRLKNAKTVFDAEIEPAPLISGNVVDAKGQPVKDALVFTVEDSLSLDESRLPLTVEKLRTLDRKKLTDSGMIVSLGYSKEDGSVKLQMMDPLLRMHQWIVALHPDHGMARMRASELKEGSLFNLAPWASLGGKLLDSSGAPVVNQKVIFFIRHESASILDPSPLAPLILRQSVHATTDGEGRFALSRIAPHTILNGIELKGKYQSLTAIPITSGPLIERTLSLNPRASFGANLPTSLRTRGVRGRVVLPEGYTIRSEKYYTNLFLRAVDGDSFPKARLQDDGSFVTAVEVPGLYELSFSVSPKGGKSYAGPEASRWMRFKVEQDPAGAILDLGDIRMEKKDFEFRALEAFGGGLPAYIEGPQGSSHLTVQDHDKKPLAGAKIEVLDYLDISGNKLGVETLAKQLPALQTDVNGKARINFPRRPKTGLRVYGLQLHTTSKDGSGSRDLRLMDGKDMEVQTLPLTRLELHTTPPIVSWSLGGPTGLFVENQAATNGGIQAQVTLPHNQAFIVRGITADGQELFSEVLIAPNGGTSIFKAKVTLRSGIQVTGKINGMPATGYGEGFVSCSLLLHSNREQPILQKGSPPTVSWTSWAPVGLDGRFRLPSIPRGRLLYIGGMGRGWITHDVKSMLPYGRSEVIVSQIPDSGPLNVTLYTNPCFDRQIQVLLPDGRPGAGVILSGTYLGAPNSGTFLIQKNQSQAHLAQDNAAYAAFTKTFWPFGQLVADSDGRLTLPNLPKGEVTTTIYWPLPGTDFPQRDRPKIIIPTDPAQVITVRLIGKP